MCEVYGILQADVDGELKINLGRKSFFADHRQLCVLCLPLLSTLQWTQKHIQSGKHRC